jgi:hypothetical protein
MPSLFSTQPTSFLGDRLLSPIFSFPQATSSSNTLKSYFEFPAEFTSEFKLSNGLAYRKREGVPAALPTTAEGPPQEST